MVGFRIKYGNLEVGNTTQQLSSTTRPCCSIEFIASFLFDPFYIQVSYIRSFFVIFNSNVFSALHVKHFEIWKKYFVKSMSRLLHSTIHQVMWYFWIFIVNPFYLLWSFFFLKKIVFPLVSLPLAYRLVNQLRYFR